MMVDVDDESLMYAQETLTFLIDETNVITCKRGQQDAITSSEIGMSTTMLNMGWNIGSMLVATRGFDFRQNKDWNSLIVQPPSNAHTRTHAHTSTRAHTTAPALIGLALSDDDAQDPNNVGWYFNITPGIHETVFVKMTRQFLSKEMHAYGTMARQQQRNGFFDGMAIPHAPADNFPVPLDVCPPPPECPECSHDVAPPPPPQRDDERA
jgi:hypothetical protein